MLLLLVAKIALLTHVALKVTSSLVLFHMNCTKIRLSYSMLVDILFLFPLKCQDLYLYLWNTRGKPQWISYSAEKVIYPNYMPDVFCMHIAAISHSDLGHPFGSALHRLVDSVPLPIFWFITQNLLFRVMDQFDYLACIKVCIQY